MASDLYLQALEPASCTVPQKLILEMKTRKISLALILLSVGTAGSQQSAVQNWTHTVRIGGYSLHLDRVDSIIRDATATHVFGIETDNDIPGRYDSFLDPTEKLKAIQAVATKAHQADNYVFVYIAGLECITAHADQRENTFFKDHPDWVQRKITGEPAVFGGGTAFWIAEGDEDVWISPYAREWRKIYMNQVRQIAATGIDGVYVDIPYWMTHFKGWEDSWASFDDYTVAAFKEKTGLNAKRDIKLGDYSDPGFIQWIDFRIQTLTDFMKDVDDNVKAVNPKCKTIAEIYPGIEQAAVRVGADVYRLYEVVDVIAHEYEPDSGNHMAASKSPLDWFEYMTGMYSFRSFAGDKASWMLSYSWDGDKKIDPKEAMKNLLVAQLMAGTNCWDAKGHVMSGSNDPETRTVVFQWIAAHEKTFYSPREPVHPIGIYFSPQTRNYFPEEFMGSYKGLMNLLLQSHQEFQVITPRNLQGFKGNVLALPDARCLGGQEMDLLKSFVESGKSLIITAETGAYNEKREIQRINPIHQLLGITQASQKIFSAAPKRFLYYPDCPGKKYSLATRRSFNGSAARGRPREASFYKVLSEFSREIREVSKSEPTVDVEASPFVSAQIAKVNGKAHVFMANFKGLKGGQVAQQIPERNVKITFPAEQKARIYILPFLGQVQEAKAEWSNGKAYCVIPEIEKGAVVWCE